MQAEALEREGGVAQHHRRAGLGEADGRRIDEQVGLEAPRARQQGQERRPGRHGLADLRADRRQGPGLRCPDLDGAARLALGLLLRQLGGGPVEVGEVAGQPVVVGGELGFRVGELAVDLEAALLELRELRARLHVEVVLALEIGGAGEAARHGVGEFLDPRPERRHQLLLQLDLLGELGGLLAQIRHLLPEGLALRPGQIGPGGPLPLHALPLALQLGDHPFLRRPARRHGVEVDRVQELPAGDLVALPHPRRADAAGDRAGETDQTDIGREQADGVDAAGIGALPGIEADGRHHGHTGQGHDADRQGLDDLRLAQPRIASCLYNFQSKERTWHPAKATFPERDHIFEESAPRRHPACSVASYECCVNTARECEFCIPGAASDRRSFL